MSDQKEQPKLIAQRIDVKTITLYSFASTLQSIKDGLIKEISIDSSTTVSLLTNFGVITGDIEDISGDPDHAEDITKLNKIILKARNHALVENEKALGEDVQVVNNSGIIVIANARVTIFSNPNAFFNFQKLFLFTDQIVGFTYGQLSIVP